MTAPDIAATAIIHPNVVVGEGAVIEDFCIIGAPPRGKAAGELPTVIGAGAYIRSHTVIYAGNVIGDNFQTGNKANVRESNRIGNDVSVGSLSVVEHHVEIGDGARIHTQVFVPEYCVIGARAWIGPNVVLTNARYPAARDTKDRLVGVTLDEACRIGANSTVLPGIRVGARTLVGAGSVVTRDLPADVVAYGNPAQVRRQLQDIDSYRDDPAR